METIIGLLASIFFTYGLGLLPAYLVRYKIFKKPLKKRWAVLLAFFFFSIQLVLATIIQEAQGINNKRHTALSFVAIISFYIMIKKKETQSS